MVVVGTAVAILVTLVAIGLKMAGRSVPVLDQIVSLVNAGVKLLPKKAPPAPAPDEKTGLAAVVDIKSAPEDKK